MTDIEKQQELVKALKTLGYPHNFQHENSWVVDYLYKLANILTRYVFTEESKSEDAPTDSHCEKDVLKMCIMLMNSVYKDMLEYMEFMGVEVPKNEDEEGYPRFTYTYGKIVQMLFLWNTHHSGGTSTMRKCRDLGVNYGKSVVFEPESEVK